MSADFDDADVFTSEFFRRWPEDFTRPADTAERAMSTIRRLQSRVRTGGRKFTRDEMNER